MTPTEREVLCLKAIVSSAQVSVEAAVSRLDAAGVTASDFSESRVQALFMAVESDLRAGRQPEIVSLLKVVGKRVPRDIVLDVLEGDAGASVGQRLSVLRELGQRRATSATLRTLAALFEQSGSLDDANAELTRAVAALGAKGGTIRLADYTAHELINRLEEVQLGKRVPVVPTGIDALDFVIGGFQPTLTVIGALPAVGKSALIATAIENMTRRGEMVGLLSLEDKADWLTTRLVSKASSIPVPVLAFKKLTESQKAKVDTAIVDIHDQVLVRLAVEDRHGLTTTEVVASARKMVAMGCKAILVDHLGEVRLERTDRHDLDIADALSQLRGIAKTYGVPVVVLCHLRRREGLDAESEPKLTDFAFSAGVERMSRVALGLWRSGEQLAVSVLKQTNGPAQVCVCLDMHKTSGTVLQTYPSAELRAHMRSLWGEP